MHKPDWKTPKGMSPELFSTSCERSLSVRQQYESAKADPSNADFQRLSALADNTREKVDLSIDALRKYISLYEIATPPELKTARRRKKVNFVKDAAERSK